MFEPISDAELAELRANLSLIEGYVPALLWRSETMLEVLARLDAAEQGRARAIANQERWLEAAEMESIARRAAEAEAGRLRALLAEVRPHIGRCNVSDDMPCYGWDNTTDLEDRIAAALAPAE